MSEKYQTIEERLGILTGILQNIPTQIEQLYSKVNSIAEEQADLHAKIGAKLDQLDKDVDRTCARDRSNCPYYDRFKATHKLENEVKEVQKFVKDSKDDKSFLRKHLATFIVSLASFVLGSLVVYALLNMLGG